ncbi:sugar ABC transporter ATP-binding protein [Amphibiibacter pelophylacis]|uniref:Sugar ABC transporter ATP-binding protein n=1 Tax=Amphibiibacter pelophylacis TaxID=1799477 RepID=A0ACC6NYI2_9BURK
MSAVAQPAAPVLQLEGVGKDYVTQVLDRITLSLRPGEVLALTGENGAGKSTLSKIMAGLVEPTRGTLLLDGQPFAPRSRREAEDHGVRMVMQELSLVATLTVAENLALGSIPHGGLWRAGRIDRSALRQFAQQQLARMGLQDIDLDTPVGRLGIGTQQLIEIARNLRDSTRVLLLDEPTAMLTPRETQELFTQIRRLKAQGVAMVYVSHRLEELRAITDTMAILRDGQLVDWCPTASLSEAEVIERMVGRPVDQDENQPTRPAGARRLSVQGLGRGDVVRDVSLELHAGQIFGIAGLVGSGRTELLRLIFGADRADRGRVELYPDTGAPVVAEGGWRSPAAALAHGVGLVTEDRKAQGLLLPLPIRINATLSDTRAVARAGVLQTAQERARVADFVQRLRVRCQSQEQPVGQLSGGNQQKVVFARWMHRPCQVLLLDEPTRGVDVGARADIYAVMEQMCAQGCALLVVSSDLRELMAISDRIGVMCNGELASVFERGQWTEQSLLAAAFPDAAEPSEGHGQAASPTESRELP